MSSPQSKQQMKLNQLNSILSTNNNSNSTNQQTLNEVEEETISKEVNLWKIRELAITDGGLLNGTYVLLFIIIVFIVFIGSYVYSLFCIVCLYFFVCGVVHHCIYWLSKCSRRGCIFYICVIRFAYYCLVSIYLLCYE